MTGANPATDLTSPQIIPPTDPGLLITGTTLKVVGSFYQPGHLTTVDNFTIAPYEVSFYTDADLVQFRAQTFGFKYRLLVDGLRAHGAAPHFVHDLRDAG